MEIWRADGAGWYKEPATELPETGFTLELIINRYRLPLSDETDTRFLVFTEEELRTLQKAASVFSTTLPLFGFLGKIFTGKPRFHRSRYTWIDGFVFIPEAGPLAPEKIQVRSTPSRLAYGMDMRYSDRRSSGYRSGYWWVHTEPVTA